MSEEHSKPQVVEIQVAASSAAGIAVLVAGFRALLSTTEASNIPLLTSSLLGNVFGSMSEDSWRTARHTAQTPCGRNHCDCHIRRGALMDAIELERESYQRGLKAIGKHV